MKESSSQYIDRTSKEYSIYVCDTRAIPKVTDGLKDGQRKALWLLRNKADKIKTVALSGQMIAEELFVHGDSSASNTISGLAAPYLNNIPLVDGIGSFGSKLAPDAWGAPRYTYVKRNNAAQDILYADLDIVPLMDNYDGSNQSAATFLPLIPVVLLNGISGIAVGWSTEILPHDLGELVDSCVAAIDNKKIKKLKPCYKNYALDIEHIEDSSWLLKGKVKIIDHANAVITEITPGIKIEKLREHLDDLEEKGKIQGYKDRSTENIYIEVQFKRGTLKGAKQEELVDLFKIKSRVTERIVVQHWSGQGITTYDSPEHLIKDFVEWRLLWFRKRYEKLLADTKELLKFERAVKLCFDKKLPDQLSSFKDKQSVFDAVADITDKLKIDEKQIDRIVSFPSYKWAKDNYQAIKKEIDRLEILIDEYKDILNDENKIKAIYKSELTNIKKRYA